MKKPFSHWGITLAACGVVLAGGIGTYALGSSEPSRAAAPSPSPPAAQTAPAQTVNTIKPKHADMTHKFDTNGSLEAYETADLYAKVSGYLSEIRVDIGDHVKAGQVLALISIPEMEKELAEAQAQLAAKRADATLQQVTLERQEMLFRGRGTTEQAYDEAKSKAAVAAAQVDLAAATVDKIRTLLGYTRIVAPFDGVVTARNVDRGDFVQAATAGRNTALVTVQRIDVIRVFSDVPESEIAKLKVGLRATIKPYGLNGKTFEGKVARFARTLNPQTRNMRTEIDLPNPGELLYPGMYAQVSLETERHPGVLTLPAPAVATDANGKFVYQVVQGRIAKQTIQIGMTEGGVVEVISGIPSTADVVMVAQGAPSPGTPVTASPHET